MVTSEMISFVVCCVLVVQSYLPTIHSTYLPEMAIRYIGANNFAFR